MLGLLSFLALNENLNAIWLNAVGMASEIVKFLFEAQRNSLSVTKLRTPLGFLHGITNDSALRAF